MELLGYEELVWTVAYISDVLMIVKKLLVKEYGEHIEEHWSLSALRGLESTGETLRKTDLAGEKNVAYGIVLG